MTSVVTIAYRTIPHYREPFYRQLRERLASDDILLRLLAGDPDRDEALRRDTASVEWAEPLGRHKLPLGPGPPLEWQRVLRSTQHDDLLILEDAVRLASNVAALLRRKRKNGQIVGLWGHGVDLQKGDGSLKGSLRRYQQRNSDWYFAYTEKTAETVVANGVPRQRVTVVNNTIDTSQLIGYLSDVTSEAKQHLLDSLGLESDHFIAVYSGGLYWDKRIPFLLEAGRLVAEALPDFRLVMIGDGPERSMVSEAASQRQWLSYLGPSFGHEKATALSAACLSLMPGAVGLAIIDFQLAGAPTVTIANAGHGPEIDYLKHEQNGLLLEQGTTPAGYAHAIIELLQDRPRLEALAQNARDSANALPMDAMVERFSQGVRSALKLS